MTITFTPGAFLQNDQTAGVQDIGDDTDVDFTDGVFATLKARVLANFTLMETDNVFAELVDGATQTTTMTVESDGEIQSIRFTDALVGGDGVLLDDPSGLTTVDGHNIVLTADTDALFADTVVFGIDEVTGEVVFAIQMIVNFNGDNSEATIDLNIISYQPVFHADSPDNFDEPVDLGDFLRIEVNDETGLFDFSALAATKFLFGVVGDTNGGFLVIGKDPAIDGAGDPINGGGAGDLINTSKGGGATTIGVNNQHFTADSDITDVEQGAYFTCVFDMAAGTFGNANDITTMDLVEATEARLQVSQTQAAGQTAPGMKITTLNYDETDIADGIDFVNDLTEVLDAHGDAANLSGLRIYATSPSGVALVDLDLSLFTPDPTTDISPISDYEIYYDSLNMVRIIGLEADNWVEWDTVGVHTRVLVEAVSGKWDIGAFEVDLPGQDFASIGQQIVIDDDGPSFGMNGPLLDLVTDDTDIIDMAMASFAGVFSPDFGTDGGKDAGNDGMVDADAVTYALDVSAPGVASGLTDTLSNESVALNLVGGDVVGTTSVGGDEVFRVSVDENTGDVTLTQTRSVVHDNISDPIETGAEAEMLTSADLITLTATATDDDGDQATDTVDIGDAFKFEDDGPSITRNGVSVPMLVTDDTDIIDSAGPTSFAGLFTEDFGKDGFKDTADNDDTEDADAVTYTKSH